MKKVLLILLFVICLNLSPVYAQTYDIETKVINAAGLKELVTSQKGKPLLLNFWATWCGPCHAEFPELVKINEDYHGKGLAFNVVSVDTIGLLHSGVPKFLESYNVVMPSYLIDLPNRRAIAKAIRQISPTFRDVYPLTLLFDKNGKLVYQKIGRINDKTLRAEIDKVLKK